METHSAAANNSKTHPCSILEMVYANTPIKGKYSSQTATERVKGMSQGPGQIIDQQ
ncbi:hypothetical protein IMY05_C1043000200 [Salix suchowensis]|nr:hypothetical protein IMY05_C1043000200 [Salix suchowensis]